jgi:hypothetical protein
LARRRRIDGDGRGDVIIGAYLEDVGSFHFAGRAYLFSGASGALIRTLTSPNPQSPGDFGFSVSGVPDADGDGVEDIAVGADYEASATHVNAGHVYLFSGANGALLRTLSSSHERAAGLFGYDVSGIPDVDGDGRGDLIVSAYGEVNGRVYGISGATGAVLYSFVSPNAGTLDGRFANDVVGMPDIDGDGRGDILIGSSAEERFTGRAYLYSGATASLLYELQSPNSQPGGEFGASVSAVMDVDGDGRTDLLIGATRENPGDSPEDAGRAYVFSGATGTLLETLISPNEEEFGTFGAVAGVDDIDGDGRGDFLIGAAGESPGSSPSNAGRAYLFSSSNGITLSVDAEPVNPPIVIPPGGGSFSFTVTVTNTGTETESFALWTRITRPNGQQTNAGLGPFNRTLAPGASFRRTFSQSVPGNMSAGTYTYTAYIGTYPNGPVASDTFMFTKQSVGLGDDSF